MKRNNKAPIIAGLIVGSLTVLPLTISWLLGGASWPIAIGGGGEKAAVERWLHEHLDDPDYEIVKWYGPIQALGDVRDAEKAVPRGSMEWDEYYNKLIQWCRDHRQRFKVIGVKLREKTGFGKRLDKRTFIIKDGEVEELGRFGHGIVFD
ncbi:MAG: hypothetical protein ACREQ5_04135 [Candidatus Dormibacteria bacterium]